MGWDLAKDRELLGQGRVTGASDLNVTPETAHPGRWLSKDGTVQLSEPWAAALGLAWEAMLAGSTPVGSVVINADRRIVTRGRGLAMFAEADKQSQEFGQ